MDGTVNLWNLNVDSWQSITEQNFDLEDKSRLLLKIDEVRGCLKTKQIRLKAPNGIEHIEYVLEDV